MFYAADIAGSDIERHPESFSNQLGRHYPECLYQNGTYASSYGLTSYLKENDIYASLYAVVSKANAVITSMENAENFESIINGGQSEMGQMYGEAVAMRATAYRELCKNFEMFLTLAFMVLCLKVWFPVILFMMYALKICRKWSL